MEAAEQALARGDRAPDFWLPNPEGKLGRFYDRFKGNLVVLFFFSSAKEAASREMLQGFVAAAEALRAEDAAIVAVTGDPHSVTHRLWTELALDFTLFSDPKGAIARGYGAGVAGHRHRSLLIDRNQRIVQVFDGPPSPARAGEILARLQEANLSSQQGGSVSAQAPVLIVPDVFDPALCERLIADWQESHAEGEIRARVAREADGATRVVDHALKKRLDHRPRDSVNQELIALAVRRIAPETLRAFYFQPAIAERFCIGAYDAGRGDYFRPHRDNTTQQTAHRRFAITLNLNDVYEGGGLMFPEYGQQIYRPAAGAAVVFSCSLLHQATPVTAGRRYVALTFLLGEEALKGKRR